MERIEKEHSYKTIYYKAWDGETFCDEQQCIAHENNPAVVAWKNVQSFLVRKTNAYRLAVIYIEDETPVYVFRPTSHKDIVALNDFLNIDAWGNRGSYEWVNDSYIGKDVFVLYDNYKEVHTLEEWVDIFKENLERVLNDEETDTDYDDDEEKIVREYHM